MGRSAVLYGVKHLAPFGGPAFAACFGDADQDGRLASFLMPPLTPAERTTAEVEGWILGVT